MLQSALCWAQRSTVQRMHSVPAHLANGNIEDSHSLQDRLWHWLRPWLGPRGHPRWHAGLQTSQQGLAAVDRPAQRYAEVLSQRRVGNGRLLRARQLQQRGVGQGKGRAAGAAVVYWQLPDGGPRAAGAPAVNR